MGLLSLFDYNRYDTLCNQFQKVAFCHQMSTVQELIRGRYQELILDCLINEKTFL